MQVASISSNESPDEALSDGLRPGGAKSSHEGEAAVTSKVPHLVEHIEGIVSCLMKLKIGRASCRERVC